MGAPPLKNVQNYFKRGQCAAARTLHYVFRSILALHSFRLKLCSVKYIVHWCTTPMFNIEYATLIVKTKEIYMVWNRIGD